MSSDESNPYYEYYEPSIAAAVIIAILFAVAGLIQIWRIIATRQWFGIVILIAAGCTYPINPSRYNERLTNTASLS